MTPVTTAKEAIEAAADACLDAAWKHGGNDAYSQGMDHGAAHQVEACVKAIRAIPVADPVGVTVADDPRVAVLVELLKEARRDLSDYVDAEYPKSLRENYPSCQSRWKRDMELCRRIDAALAAFAPDNEKEPTE